MRKPQDRLINRGGGGGGTNCYPLVADWFLFCYERDFMLALSDNNETYIIEAIKIVSEYDQEIPQSQTADNPMAPRGRATQP